MSQRSSCVDAVRKPAAKHPEALVSGSTVSQHEQFEKEGDRYLPHNMGRTVHAVRRHPSIVAIQTKVDVFTFLAFKSSSNNVQVASASASGKRSPARLKRIQT